jgi:2-methylcitrate dehydratase PrpD
MGDDATRTAITSLSQWAADLDFDDIPQPVVEKAEQLVLDALGVAVAATADPVGVATLDWAARFAAPGESSVIGAQRTLSRSDAALAVGTLVHALDYDDHGFGGHGTSCVLPAVLAVGQGTRISARDLLTAYVAGMEVFGRLGNSMPVVNMHGYGFHPTAVLGLVASAVAAAKAMGLSAEGIGNAVSVGSGRGAGMTASFGSMVKPLHAGFTASAGVQGAELAASGFVGNPALLESEHGFGTAYVRDLADWPAFVESLRGPYRMAVKPPSIKPVPCCGGNQRSIQNLRRIMAEHDLADGDIAKVDVHVNPRQLVTLRYDWPTSTGEAKFCLPFTVATTLTHGGPTLAAFAGRYWENEQVLAARERVSIIPDGDGDKNYVVLVVTTTDGRQFTRDEFVMHGSGGDPMSWGEISAKYQDSSDYGKVAPEATSALHDAIRGMGSAPDARAAGERFWRAWAGTGELTR